MPYRPLDSVAVLKRIHEGMEDAEKKAWEALAGYKFLMFGYHAARWVNYSKALGGRRANPFRDAVLLARKKSR
jgi:hypothetical protein